MLDHVLAKAASLVAHATGRPGRRVLTSAPLTARTGQSFRCWMLNAGTDAVRVDAHIVTADGIPSTTVRGISVLPGATECIAGSYGVGSFCRVEIVEGPDATVRASFQVTSLWDGSVVTASDAR